MKRNVWLALALVAVFIIGSLVFTQCSTKKEPDVYKIGGILPLTGNLAKLGEPKKEAFQLAVDEINDAGGIQGKKLEVVLGDNKGEPKEGISVLQKQINIDKIHMFYVDITAVGYACVPVADRNGVVMFIGSAHPAITEGSEWAFRIFTSGDQETDILSDYLVKEGAKSVFIIHTNEILGESTKEYLKIKFSAHGGKVSGSESYQIGQQDFRSILTKAKNSNADKIVLLGYGVTFPTIIKQINEFGIPHSRVIGNIGFVGPGVIQLPEELTEGMVFTGPSFTYKSSVLEDSKVSDFVKQYKAKFGKVPDYTAAFAYDTIDILAEVLEQVGSDDPVEVRKALLNIKNYEGVSGKITFRPNGDTYTNTMLATFRDGKIALISENE